MSPQLTPEQQAARRARQIASAAAQRCTSCGQTARQNARLCSRCEDLQRAEQDLLDALEQDRADAAFLRDLAGRLFQVPVMYGVDQGDVDRLNEIAEKLQL